MDVGEVIRRGGSGIVHEGVLIERSGPREVAVKFLGAGATDKEQTSFLKEIKKNQLIGSRCEGVCITYGALIHEGRTCLVMKRYGESLGQRIPIGGLAMEDTLRYAQQTLRALVSLHEHDVVVLDLKPANLLFDDDRLVILLERAAQGQVVRLQHHRRLGEANDRHHQ